MRLYLYIFHSADCSSFSWNLPFLYLIQHLCQSLTDYSRYPTNKLFGPSDRYFNSILTIFSQLPLYLLRPRGVCRAVAMPRASQCCCLRRTCLEMKYKTSHCDHILFCTNEINCRWWENKILAFNFGPLHIQLQIDYRHACLKWLHMWPYINVIQEYFILVHQMLETN